MGEMIGVGFFWTVGALIALALSALLIGLFLLACHLIALAGWKIADKILDMVMAPRLRKWRADPRYKHGSRDGAPLRGWRFSRLAFREEGQAWRLGGLTRSPYLKREHTS